MLDKVMLLKIKCREELIQRLLHHLIHLEDKIELTVDKDQQLQTKHKCSLIEVQQMLDSQDREVLMLMVKCLQFLIKGQCSHRIRCLQSL